MTLGNPRSGLNSVAEFQVSTLPWVTSSTAPLAPNMLQISFPKVTKFMTFANHNTTGQEIRIGFTRNGMNNGYYYRLDGGQQIELDLRVTTVYVSGDTQAGPFSLIAGLTTIDAKEMPLLTGSYSDGTSWPGVG